MEPTKILRRICRGDPCVVARRIKLDSFFMTSCFAVGAHRGIAPTASSDLALPFGSAQGTALVPQRND
ncbi:MAG: hypothetical protein KAH48_02500 [Chlorobi bacterium]|nr:hypothetical protein [Chlorobiota bacterium]